MAQDPEQRVAQAMERLSEDERLRSNLTDEETRPLYAWARAQLQAAPQGASTRSSASEDRLDATLRWVIDTVREVNDLAVQRHTLSVEQARGRIRALTAGVGTRSLVPHERIEQLALQRAVLEDDEFLKRLLALLPAASLPEVGVPPTPPERGGLSGWLRGCGLIGLLVALLLGTIATVASRCSGTLPLTTPTPIQTDAVSITATPTLRPATTTPIPAPTRTPSPAAAAIQAYFTAPIYPDNPANHRGGPDERFTALLQSAQRSIDLAAYMLDLEKATQALLQAKQRGVTVRLVTDIDMLDDPTENGAFQRLQSAGVTIVGGNPDAIMHNKFAVVDGRTVVMGSWNFTDRETYRYNNNLLIIQSTELARNYTVTFEKMWRDRQFSAGRRAGGTQPRLTIGGIPVESYFSPEDNVASHILPRLEAAQRSIHFMAFAFTSDDMGDVLLARARAGVQVQGVFERQDAESGPGEYPRLKQAGLDVLLDGNPYLMHHKVIVIDGRTVITGSYNFSRSAEERNDENVLIVDDASLAAQYEVEFQRVYAQARDRR